MRMRKRAWAHATLLLTAALLPRCSSDSDDGTSNPSPSPSTPGACTAGTPVPGTPELTLTPVASGLRLPLDLQAPRGDATRLFVVEQGGKIKIIRGGAVLATPFMDIGDRTTPPGGELGLLGLAFHPQYTQNGRFYVNYTNRDNNTTISEFRAASGTADTADPASERKLVFVAQPFGNHKGGGLAFGSDGYLYIGLGDGGSAGDPQENAQNLGRALGKMLRIDVNSGNPYAVPVSNPFVGTSGAVPEVWAYGLRNPFRFSFDRASGDLFIGDVGQGEVEEVDVGARTRGGGENYGWNITEGNRCFEPRSGCNTAGLTPPVVTYNHDLGCSVTGGYVYRGCRMPGYVGTYFYGDFCSGLIRSFRLVGGAAAEQRDWSSALASGRFQISSFGEDSDGEIYVIDYGGQVLRLSPAS